ncbi:hypothetical protein GN956_G19563 [Arapaima gigas]
MDDVSNTFLVLRHPAVALADNSGTCRVAPGDQVAGVLLRTLDSLAQETCTRGIFRAPSPAPVQPLEVQFQNESQRASMESR